MNQIKKGLQILNEALFPIAGEYALDPVHSFAAFTAQHLIVGQVRGRFNSLEGRLVITDNPLQSTIEISIPTATVSTHNEMRDKDIRSNRYLETERFPVMTFQSAGFIPEPGGNWTVNGNLTIRDVTLPVSLAVIFGGIVADPWGNTRAAFHGTTRVNRKDFGLLTDLARETGGLLVGKDIVIDFASELLLKS
jgi:polyisoprenoid-binding protein YceI